MMMRKNWKLKFHFEIVAHRVRSILDRRRFVAEEMATSCCVH